MRLQIKKLEGPDEIKINNDRTLPSYAAAMANNQTANKFTCYFNQTLSAASFDEGDIEVIIKIYDNEGSEHTKQRLTVQNTHVTDSENNYTDHFHFSLTLDSPETFSGSYFHIHAILVNADANAQNIGYRVSSYHTSIKQVYISDEPEFLEVYWTTAEIPGADPTETVPENRPENVPVAGENETANERTLRETWERERPQREQNRQTTRQTTRQTQRRERERTGQIHQNEDALLYIRTIGMYNKSVAVVITANNDEVVLVSKSVRMKQNRRVLAYPMNDLMQRYRQRTGNQENEGFTLKAWAFYRNDSGEVTTAATTQERPNERVIQYALSVMPLLPPTMTRRVSRITLQGIEHESPDPADNMIFGSSGNLELVLSDADTPAKATSTGTVYVRVANRETSTITPTKFRDFRIGFMCHIEGVGRKVDRINNNQNDSARYTVYPFNVYEILLSDLVACGLVTVDEAAYLTTTNHDGINLRTREYLESHFDKINAPLSSTKTLISIFRDTTNNDRARETTIRKLLAQVSGKEHHFSNNRNEYNNIREICRDAWQKVSRRDGVITKLHRRPDDHRYSKNKECPPGTYFLNYATGSYCVYVSRYPTGKTIDEYDADTITRRSSSPNTISRGSIALHRGGASASTGCLTFNISYGGNGQYTTFYDTIYPGGNNIRRLNFICIDERNAIRITNNDPDTYSGIRRQVTDTSTDPATLIWINQNDIYNFYRFYDLIDPDNDLGLNF